MIFFIYFIKGVEYTSKINFLKNHQHNNANDKYKIYIKHIECYEKDRWRERGDKNDYER